jgi:hypothetical protein
MIRHKRLIATLGGAALALLPTGCAKGPSGTTSNGNGGTVTNGRQLFVTMQVRGNIDLANDYYFVCFNITPTSTNAPLTRNGFTGPVPVITDFESGGNGFAGGAFTTFVEIHQGQPQSSFGVYGMASDLHTTSYIGQPINATISGGTITFQIPLSYIESGSQFFTGGTTYTDADISQLQVNFINTDNISINPQDTTPKNFDALGNPLTITGGGGLNGFVTIPATQDTTYQNGTFGQEGTDDVATFTPSASPNGQTNYDTSVGLYSPQTSTVAANLDITNWSITFTG